MTKLENVTVVPKANVYFEGKVVSHTLHGANGEQKALGLIYPGTYHFGTSAPELMEIVSGNCQVAIDDSGEILNIETGSAFEVAGNSGFTITVDDCICEYLCSYLPA